MQAHSRQAGIPPQAQTQGGARASQARGGDQEGGLGNFGALQDFAGGGWQRGEGAEGPLTGTGPAAGLAGERRVAQRGARGASQQSTVSPQGASLQSESGMENKNRRAENHGKSSPLPQL